MSPQSLSNDTVFQALAIFAIFLHVMALVAVFLLRWGFRPIAQVNMAFAIAVAFVLGPRLFRYGFPFDSFQFLLLASEVVVFIASYFALAGAAKAPYSTVIAWIGFCGNFLLSAAMFWIAFYFRMTRLF